jgi:decaprenylphospho-beta-D-ribofuranose 2-oxidase
MKLSNWGKYPVIESNVRGVPAFTDIPAAQNASWIARGMGRCYGDSALNTEVVSTQGFNRLLAFDAQNGILTAEAGLTLADLLQVFVPRGWFLPVTPGTKYVSLGGAVASDVHGKNHHQEGSFGTYVHRLEVMLANGEVVPCSRTENADLFQATLGGMGLTGLILTVELQLKAIESAAIVQDHYKARNLEEVLALITEHADKTYSVAWIDCLSSGKSQGRSILNVGEFAKREDLVGTSWEKEPLPLPSPKALSIPLDLPSFSLNKLTIAAFNFLYYHKQFRAHKHLIGSYEPFFYPLDVIHHWNRIYGKRGFTQYQLVIPNEAGPTAIPTILNKAKAAGFGSFLAVLKQLGPASEGLISFPMPGLTLTLDFPIRQKLFPLLDELDHIVADLGGRVYLTKDVRLGAEMFRRMYPRHKAFTEVLRKYDPEGKVQSLQSRRLGLH